MLIGNPGRQEVKLTYLKFHRVLTIQISLSKAHPLRGESLSAKHETAPLNAIIII